MQTIYALDLPRPGHLTTVGDSSYFSLPLTGLGEVPNGLDFVVRTPEGEFTFEWIEVESGLGLVGEPVCIDVIEELTTRSLLARAFIGIRQAGCRSISLDALQMLLGHLLTEIDDLPRPAPARTFSPPQHHSWFPSSLMQEAIL